MKKRHSIFSMTIMIFTLVAIFSFLGFAFRTKYVVKENYELALRYMEQEQFDDAIDLLLLLKNYKNGEELLKEAEQGKQYVEAKHLYDEEKYEQAYSIFAEIIDYKDSEEYALVAMYEWAKSLYEEGNYSMAQRMFQELGLKGYKDSSVYVAKCDLKFIESSRQLVYEEACKLYDGGKYEEALDNFLALGDYEDSAEKASKCIEYITRVKHAKTISAGVRYSLGVTEAGKVVIAGLNLDDRCNVNSWENIVSVSGYGSLTIGLKDDGTVVTAGKVDEKIDLEGWDHIVDISAGDRFVVGLRQDGTVVAAGHNGDKQINVTTWTGVTEIATGWRFTVGLTENKDLLYAGYDNGQAKAFSENKAAWKDVVKIAASGGGKGEKCRGKGHTVGLKEDGTVVAIGDNTYRQCEVADWTDIIAIAAGDWYTVGLKKDGTVVITGQNISGTQYIDKEIYEWRDIVDIAAGFGQTLGLRKDGTVVAIGFNNDNERDGTLDWRNIRVNR